MKGHRQHEKSEEKHRYESEQNASSFTIANKFVTELDKHRITQWKIREKAVKGCEMNVY